MRNIKITALLLAVLMVVAAFAGCASKSTVSNLDNKVNDLATEIEKQENALAGIQDSIKDLADAINKGSELDDVKDAVEDNKQDIADIKDMLEDLIGTEESADALDKAIIKAGAEIDALKGDFEDEKVHYVAADVAAIRALLGGAQAKVSACKDAAAVEAEMAALKAELAKFSRVDDALYAYVEKLTGNITGDSVADVEAAEDALKAAVEFYDEADLEKAITEYAVEDKKVDLVAAIEKLMELQYDEYPDLVLEAEHLNQDIAKVDFTTDVDAIEALELRYRNFVRHAKELSEKNIALVTENGKLAELLASAKNVRDAIAALLSGSKTWFIPSQLAGVVDANGDPEYLYAFNDYDTLAANYQQSVIRFYGHDADKDGYADVVKISKIYDAIDAWAADFKEYFELGDYAYEYVIKTVTGDEDYLAKYEADKALANAFLADYDELVAGLFADIKDFAYERLSVSSSYDLAVRYINNANAIRAWEKAHKDAYKAYLRDLKDLDTASYNTEALYATLLNDNFQAMVILAGLGDYTSFEVDNQSVQYDKYFLIKDAKDPAKFVWVSDFVLATAIPSLGTPATIDVTTATAQEIRDFYYFDLYPFDFAIRSDILNSDANDGNDIIWNDTLGYFADLIVPAAKYDADILNTKITNFRENEQQSIAYLVTALGGYHEYYNTDAKKLVAIHSWETGVNPYRAETIAHFFYTYQTSKVDLSKMVNTELYTAKLDTIQKNVEEGYKALKALMDAYYAIRGNYNNVLVTTKNADAIIALEALLIKVVELGAHNMQMATLVNTTPEKINEYELEFIVADYIENVADVTLADAQEFYDEYLLATNYKDTKKNTVDTGAFVRLIYKARTLLKEEANVAKAYELVNKINGLNAKAFGFAELNDLKAYVAKCNSTTYANLANYGYMYGVTAAETSTVTVNNTTKYHATVKVINFRLDNGGFFEYTLATTDAAKFPAAPYASVSEAYQAVWTYIRANSLAGAYSFANATDVYNYMFAEDGYLVSLVRDTDFEELGVIYNKFIPTHVLPMLAIYLEGKFMVNNAGIVSEKIEAAKKGFGTPASCFGFIKAMVVNQLRYIDETRVANGVNHLNDIRLSSINNCADYDALTIALLQADERDFGYTIESIIFADVDATWLAKTYDLRVEDFYINAEYNVVDVNAYDEYVLADGTAFLDTLAGLDVITIYDGGYDWEQVNP